MTWVVKARSNLKAGKRCLKNIKTVKIKPFSINDSFILRLHVTSSRPCWWYFDKRFLIRIYIVNTINMPPCLCLQTLLGMLANHQLETCQKCRSMGELAHDFFNHWKRMVMAVKKEGNFTINDKCRGRNTSLERCTSTLPVNFDRALFVLTFCHYHQKNISSHLKTFSVVWKCCHVVLIISCDWPGNVMNTNDF